jgi:hypothetical protein
MINAVDEDDDILLGYLKLDVEARKFQKGPKILRRCCP